MINHTKYNQRKHILETETATIYQAFKIKEQTNVLIKFIKQQFYKEDLNILVTRFKKSLELTESFSPKLLSLDSTDNTLQLVFENDGLDFFSNILNKEKIELVEFFTYAILITRKLKDLHKKRIVHLDFRPNNILISSDKKSTFFISFFSRSLPLESNHYQHPVKLDEDLYQYTSPEQTGRINLQVDQRSDLYSLGVLFYEMLNHKKLFNFQDHQSLIHNHIAKIPAPIDSIPETINGIILKLLSKSVEDRYQSAYGLLKDLEQCQEAFIKKQKIPNIGLGKYDYIDQFHFPVKLYGAQKNILKLLKSFNRVCTGSVELTIVKGSAGMGKSTLIRELYEHVHLKKGYIAEGKYGKEYRDTPFYSLVKAFQNLIRQILTEDESVIEKWKDKLMDCLGQNGQLLIDFIPEIEIIIGNQPPVPEVSPDEAQNRLNHIFNKFLQTFTSEGRPLVIFLDSFQWADIASIQLIRSSLIDINSKYIQIILAYREASIINAHTLSIAKDAIQSFGTRIQEIVVESLKKEDILLLIEEALSFKQDYESLASLILQKTNGNPFFAKQLLKTFYDKRLIQFDATAGCWVWDLNQIQEAEISENVIELMTDKILDFPSESIEIMKVASCIGSQFDLETLSIASGINGDIAEGLLKKPLQEGLILLLPLKNQPEDSSKNKNYKFLHSRVHLASYNMLTQKEKKQTHLMVGRLLLNNVKPEEFEKHVFKIVNHMNLGISLIKDLDQKHQLATLNLNAGEISKLSSAYDAAWKYFALGTDLLSEKSWEENYELCKSLYLSRSESEYYCGSDIAAEPIFDLLLNYVKTNREKVEVINIKLNLYIKNGRFRDAIEIGIDALETLFKEKIPPNDAEVTIISQVKVQEIHSTLDQPNIKNLFFLPEMEDVNIKALMELITNIIPAAYYIRRNLWILLTLKMIDLSRKHGNTVFSAFGYMNYAVLLCSGLEDFKTGHAMGLLALDINNKFKSTEIDSQLNFLFGSYICHVKDNAHKNLYYLRRSYQAGIEYGDFVSAANSVNFLMKTHIIIGSHLKEIGEEIRKYQDFVEQYNDQDLKNIIEITKLFDYLMKTKSQGDKSSIDILKEDQMIVELKASKNVLPLQWYYLIKAQLMFIFSEYTLALELIRESDKLIVGYSQLAVSEHYFYYSIIITANYHNFTDDNKKRYWDILKNNYQKLKKLSENCPVNYQDKFEIISAQMAGISGNFIEAITLFDEAIKTAKVNGRIQNEAIANELAARYFLSKDKKTIAGAYLKAAAHAYTRWGALAKNQQLESDFPILLAEKRPMLDQLEYSTAILNKGKNKINYKELIHSNQNISSELILDKLLQISLRTVMEHAGATSGQFLLDLDGQLRIAAEGVFDNEPPVKISSFPLEEYDSIAKGVIFYVIRTGKPVKLDDAANEGIFIYDHYISKNNLKSILCLPISSHGKLTGVIYLENKLTVQAFSDNITEVLSVILSQIAITLDNSLLYSNLAKITGKLNKEKSELEEKIQKIEEQTEKRDYL
jgi:predicted ATPase/GAF domain-containing protein